MAVNNRITYGEFGLKQLGGYVYEEFLRKLEGNLGARTYREMSANHSVIGAVLQAVETVCVASSPRVEAADDSPEEKEKADFISECLNDLEHSWEQYIREAVRGMMVYGWVVHEKLFKFRNGRKPNNPRISSKFSDGQIGWRGFAIRPQDSLLHWVFDDEGYPIVMRQLPPTGGLVLDIPLSKCIHLRTDASKQNPEGRSMLRNSYVSWFYQKRIMEIEAIGVDRDLTGLPMALIPSEYMSSLASDDKRALYDLVKKIVTRVKNDEQAGFVFPSDRDEKGNLLFEFKLLQSGGSRRMETDPIIQRYDQRIAMTLLADFILLGHEKVGSFALADSKTSIFAKSVDALRQIIAADFNRMAIPEILALNGYTVDKCPSLVFEDLESLDLGTLGTFLSSMVGIGAITLDPGLESFLRDAAGLPAVSDDVLREAGEEMDEQETETGETPQDDPALARPPEEEASEEETDPAEEDEEAEPEEKPEDE
jgi:hypothetical protein